MSDDHPSPPPARARAVADAPAEELAARAEELARRWALALLAARPLDEMVTIPLEDLARYAPALCAWLARALSSDEELAFLVAGARDRDGRSGARAVTAGLGVLTAGWDAAAAVEHVETLRGVLWKAALQELRDPSARQVADLSDRLASVCAAVLAYVLAERTETIGAGAPRRSFASSREQVLYSAPVTSSGRVGAVLIDERDDAQLAAQPRAAWRRDDGPSVPPARERARTQEGRPKEPGALGRGASPTTPRPLPWDTPLQSSNAPPPDAAIDPGAGGESSDDPVMRLSRGPGTPVDRRS